MKSKQGTAEQYWQLHHEHDSVIAEYRKISGYLARIEHFALGVNTGIYDVKVTERAATVYFVRLYKKMLPILAVKNSDNFGKKETRIGETQIKEMQIKYHSEFADLVNRIQKIENEEK